jgi:hypothetical protein
MQLRSWTSATSLNDSSILKGVHTPSKTGSLIVADYPLWRNRPGLIPFHDLYYLVVSSCTVLPEKGNGVNIE